MGKDKHIQAIDAQRFGTEGDPGFSAQWNEAVIKRSIERADEIKKQKEERIQAGLEERSDLVYSYIRKMLKSGKDMKIEDYAGWHNLKALWGETRVRDIQERAKKLGYKV